MTLAIFPSNLPGISWDWTRTPLTKTKVNEADSGFEYRRAYYSSPKFMYSGVYQFLRASPAQAEFQELMAFIMNAQGMFSTWLFSDPQDNSVTGQGIATGDGTTTVFSLIRSFGGFVQGGIVANNVSTVYVNGSAISSSLYTITQSGSYGLDSITFGTAPTAGQLITADFTYYWPCRFLQDDPEFGNFLSNLWELKKLDFQTVK